MDDTRRALLRRTTAKYPGSIMISPNRSRANSSSRVRPRTGQHGTANSQPTVTRSVLTSRACSSSSSSDYLSSGEEDNGSNGDSTLRFSLQQQKLHTPQTANVPVDNDPSSSSSSHAKTIVRKKRTTSAADDTPTETEDTDVNERSLDQRHNGRRKAPITVNLAGTRYEVGKLSCTKRSCVFSHCNFNKVQIRV